MRSGTIVNSDHPKGYIAAPGLYFFLRVPHYGVKATKITVAVER